MKQKDVTVIFGIIFTTSISNTFAVPVIQAEGNLTTPQTSGCLWERDIWVEAGERVPSPGPCEECICRPPNVHCQRIQCQHHAGCKMIQRTNHCCPHYKCECEHKGQVYNNGERLSGVDDPCRVCYCRGGEVMCTSITCYERTDCQPRFTPGQCCPKYDHCPLESSEEKLNATVSSKREIQPWLMTKPVTVKPFETKPTQSSQAPFNLYPQTLKIREIMPTTVRGGYKGAGLGEWQESPRVRSPEVPLITTPVGNSLPSANPDTNESFNPQSTLSETLEPANSLETTQTEGSFLGDSSSSINPIIGDQVWEISSNSDLPTIEPLITYTPDSHGSDPIITESNPEGDPTPTSWTVKESPIDLGGGIYEELNDTIQETDELSDKATEDTSTATESTTYDPSTMEARSYNGNGRSDKRPAFTTPTEDADSRPTREPTNSQTELDEKFEHIPAEDNNDSIHSESNEVGAERELDLGTFIEKSEIKEDSGLHLYVTGKDVSSNSTILLMILSPSDIKSMVTSMINKKLGDTEVAGEGVEVRVGWLPGSRVAELEAAAVGWTDLASYRVAEGRGVGKPPSSPAPSTTLPTAAPLKSTSQPQVPSHESAKLVLVTEEPLFDTTVTPEISANSSEPSSKVSSTTVEQEALYSSTVPVEESSFTSQESLNTTQLPEDAVLSTGGTDVTSGDGDIRTEGVSEFSQKSGDINVPTMSTSSFPELGSSVPVSKEWPSSSSSPTTITQSSETVQSTSQLNDPMTTSSISVVTEDTSPVKYTEELVSLDEINSRET